jgi:hypothetical protein
MTELAHGFTTLRLKVNVLEGPAAIDPVTRML